MKILSCPLCEDANISIVETIETAELISLYKSSYKTDVRPYFTGINTVNLCSCEACQLMFYSPVVLGDGMFYDKLQKNKNYYPKHKQEFDIAKQYIQKTDKVLEVGSGAGYFGDLIKVDNYTGLEFSNDAIEAAHKKGLNVINESLAIHTQHHANSYDVVCSFQVLEHIDDPNNFIADCIKCLKPNGKLIFAVPSEGSFLSDAPNQFLNAPPHHATRWCDTTFEKIATLFDIKLIAIKHDVFWENFRRYYFRLLMFHKLRKIFGLPFKRYDTSLKFKLIYATAYISSRVFDAFKKTAIDGPHVTVIYEKTLNL